MPPKQLSRILFVLLVAVSLIALASAGTASAAPQAQAGPTPTPTPTCPEGYFWDPFMNQCRPIVRPCPEGTIDIQGNGQDDGGDDCQSLDIMPGVASPVGCGPEMLGVNGAAYCDTSLGLRLYAGVGCLDVYRRPYPRMMVANDLRLSSPRILPDVLGVTPTSPGWYRVVSPVQTEGLYLHEAYGQVTTDSLGRPAFDTRSLIPGPYRYPDINNVRIVLQFAQNSGAGSIWVLDNEVIASGPTRVEQVAEGIRFFMSSFPIPGSDVAFDGPDRNRGNTLPAFRLRLQTRWFLVYLATWDTFGVDGNNAYVLTGSSGAVVAIREYTSFRAWDSRQVVDAVTRNAYCNAATGYIPLPVLEGQSVLVE
jgi:hypothetical protein